MKRNRERIGAFLITSEENIDPNFVCCNYCEKVIATNNYEKNMIEPSAERLLELGNIPVPNFGWFCSQECGNKYSKEFNVSFNRDKDGNISYYD